MDYQALLYDPVYAAIGVPAVLAPASGLTTQVDLTVIDKTAGADVGVSHAAKGSIGAASFGIETVHPVAAVRMAELRANGLTRDDLDMSAITFNGRTWRVRSHVLKPSPNGLDDGEAWLILTEAQ
jgi:hypothetical protein